MLKDIVNDKCPNFSGIITGESKGFYWLDDAEDAKIAVAYSYCVGGCGVLSSYREPEKELIRDFLESTVFPALKNMGINEFKFSAEEGKIDKIIKDFYPDKTINTVKVHSYRKATKILKEAIVPEEYKIALVDAEFLQQVRDQKIDNAILLTDRIDHCWDSDEAFLERSLAYVVLHDNAIVSVIFGSSRYQRYIPVDIETVEEHRKIGLATTLTTAFVNECINRGIVTQWDCTEDNTTSKDIALRCEFHLSKSRDCNWFDI